MLTFITHTAANFCHRQKSHFTVHLIGAISDAVCVIKTIALDLCYCRFVCCTGIILWQEKTEGIILLKYVLREMSFWLTSCVGMSSETREMCGVAVLGMTCLAHNNLHPSLAV